MLLTLWTLQLTPLPLLPDMPSGKPWLELISKCSNPWWTLKSMSANQFIRVWWLVFWRGEDRWLRLRQREICSVWRQTFLLGRCSVMQCNWEVWPQERDNFLWNTRNILQCLLKTPRLPLRNTSKREKIKKHDLYVYCHCISNIKKITQSLWV